VVVVDGLSAFDEGPGEVNNLVARVMYGIAVAELELPHIVFTRNEETGATTYSGPYESGLMAMAAAESERRADRDAGGRGDITFHVAALYPALEPEETFPDTVLPTVARDAPYTTATGAAHPRHGRRRHQRGLAGRGALARIASWLRGRFTWALGPACPGCGNLPTRAGPASVDARRLGLDAGHASQA
jgi:hypothetical protein